MMTLLNKKDVKIDRRTWKKLLCRLVVLPLMLMLLSPIFPLLLIFGLACWMFLLGPRTWTALKQRSERGKHNQLASSEGSYYSNVSRTLAQFLLVAGLVTIAPFLGIGAAFLLLHHPLVSSAWVGWALQAACISFLGVTGGDVLMRSEVIQKGTRIGFSFLFLLLVSLITMLTFITVSDTENGALLFASFFLYVGSASFNLILKLGHLEKQHEEIFRRSRRNMREHVSQ